MCYKKCVAEYLSGPNRGKCRLHPGALKTAHLQKYHKCYEKPDLLEEAISALEDIAAGNVGLHGTREQLRWRAKQAIEFIEYHNS